MTHSLTCVHCGTTIALETHRDRGGTRPRAHLLSVHREILAVDGLPRWAELLQHFFVVPRRSAASL
jgi:hypothetical protein